MDYEPCICPCCNKCLAFDDQLVCDKCERELARLEQEYDAHA